MKHCFVDVETTGLNEKKNSIFELAAIVEIDRKYGGHFIQNAKPFDGDEFTKEALEKTKKTKEEILSYEADQTQLKELFEEFLKQFVDPMDRKDKMFFIGYNCEFDYRFLRQLWFEMDDKFFGSYFWFPYIDLMTITGWALMKDRTHIPNFQLATVAKAMDIPFDEEKAHGAMYDARIARNMFYKLEG